MSSEAATDRDGFLSTYAERHALGIGFIDGLTLRPVWDRHPDADRERHYYTLGFALGRVLSLLLAAGLGWALAVGFAL